MFCTKGILKNFTKFTGKHVYRSLFFNKEHNTSGGCFWFASWFNITASLYSCMLFYKLRWKFSFIWNEAITIHGKWPEYRFPLYPHIHFSCFWHNIAILVFFKADFSLISEIFRTFQERFIFANIWALFRFGF